MSEQTNVPADANADTPASGEVDAQLAEMQVAETGGETQQPEKTTEPAETQTPEVKKVVPLAALHEERRERQRLQAQLAEMSRTQQERDALIERRLAALTPKAPVPDPSVDGVGYIDHRIQELKQTIEPVIQGQQQAAQAQQRAQVEQQLKNAVLASGAEFARSNPDLTDAANHLTGMRTRELMALGTPEHEAQTKAVQELDHALMTWAYEGRNPAATAYEFAKARGYTPKQAQAGQDAEQKIATQQKGLAAAKSLGSGGASNAGKLTAEALANMSDEDFSKLTESQFRQAMGG